MDEPRNRSKKLKFTRISIQNGTDEYLVMPLDTDTETTTRVFRLRKLSPNGSTYHVRHTEAGTECDCRGFHFRKRCKHIRMLREARMLD